MSPQPARAPDWYQVLGVSRQASGSQITRAYRAGLRAYHPDTRVLADPTDPSQAIAADTALRRVRAAYTILGDPARRAAYDRDQALAHTPPRTRHAVHSSARPGRDDPPPIRAGPVHWHPLTPAAGQTPVIPRPRVTPGEPYGHGHSYDRG